MTEQSHPAHPGPVQADYSPVQGVPEAGKVERAGRKRWLMKAGGVVLAGIAFASGYASRGSGEDAARTEQPGVTADRSDAMPELTSDSTIMVPTTESPASTTTEVPTTTSTPEAAESASTSYQFVDRQNNTYTREYLNTDDPDVAGQWVTQFIADYVSASPGTVEQLAAAAADQTTLDVLDELRASKATTLEPLPADEVPVDWEIGETGSIQNKGNFVTWLNPDGFPTQAEVAFGLHSIGGSELFGLTGLYIQEHRSQ